MLFSAPEFQAFASKIMPFVLAPAKALLFVTEAFRPRVVNQTVVPVRTIEVFLTHNTGMDRDPSRNGEEGADRLTRSGIGNVWASFVASITKEVTLFKDVLDIEYGPSLPYGPTGVGEQAEVQDRAAEGPFIGIITWATLPKNPTLFSSLFLIP
ncbi:hypothetical protein MMC17_004780 [Xylographa soralifera]|nr:hypothetical protein [Xylographa soralifera]